MNFVDAPSFFAPRYAKNLGVFAMGDGRLGDRRRRAREYR